MNVNINNLLLITKYNIIFFISYNIFLKFMNINSIIFVMDTTKFESRTYLLQVVTCSNDNKSL